MKRLQAFMRDKKVDFALFTNMHAQMTSPNFFYFSGCSVYGFLVVPSKKKPFLVVPKGEDLRARATCRKGLRVCVAKKGVLKEVKKTVGRYRKVGIDKSWMTLRLHSLLKKELPGRYLDVSKECQEMRMVKTDEEIRIIKKACRITDKIYAKTFANFRSFKTEAEVASFMVAEAVRQGLDSAFRPIVASGSNGAQLHYITSDVKLKKGFCVIDYGVRYKGYCSDMTRTVYIGEPTRNELEHYSLVLKAQLDGIKAVRIGITGGEVDNILKKSLGKQIKYAFGYGHGLGIEAHEMPRMFPKFKDKLDNNMVFTIEPGLYFPKKYGIRIEDDVVIRNGKAEVLTKTPKHLLLI